MAGSTNAELRSSILAALAFFDMFDCPLTLVEVRRFLYDLSGRVGRTAPSLGEIEAVLAEDAAVGRSEGYYFLSGRQDVVATRLRRYRLAEAKFRKARRLARWARLLPSLGLLAVCNSLALSNADQESDIDLFLVCRPGTVWITRLLVGGPLRLFGQMSGEDHHADKFCLTFLLAENRLNIADLAWPGGDPYLDYWLASLVPLYDAGGVFERFLRANAWIGDRLPAHYGMETSARRAVPSKPGRGGLFLRLLRALEPWARRLQEGRFPRRITEMANVDSRVVISADLLKFHTNDRRAQFQKMFRARLAGLGVTV